MQVSVPTASRACNWWRGRTHAARCGTATRSGSTSHLVRSTSSIARARPWRGRSERFLNTGANTILHLGLGSFHRAHQAVYLHRLRETGDITWSIVGANIRNDMADTMAALIAQNGAYTLETVSPSGRRDYEWIGAIRKVIPFDPSHAGL